MKSDSYAVEESETKLEHITVMDFDRLTVPGGKKINTEITSLQMNDK